MLEIIKTLKDTPLPIVLVIGGLIFLLIPFIQKINAKEVGVETTNQSLAGVIGFILLCIGIGLYVIPNSSSQPAEASPMSTESAGEVQVAPTSLSALNVQESCMIQFLKYIDTRSASPLNNGFQASIGHNDDGSIKIFLSGQGETYRNYYQFTGECTSDKKIELLRQQLQDIEINVRKNVPNFTLQEPVIVP